MDDCLLDFVAQEETNPEWRELVENEIQPELSGILKRVSEWIE